MIDLLDMSFDQDGHHGHWIEGSKSCVSRNYDAECSECGANIKWAGCDMGFNACPYCHAIMDRVTNSAKD